jgi:hypothetical protein
MHGIDVNFRLHNHGERLRASVNTHGAR